MKQYHPRTIAEQRYDELAIYTLSLGDPEFIHQYAVDAFAAQTATEQTKPVTITFALIGLYLHLEKGYTGRAVHLAHMELAKRGKDWPRFSLPQTRGTVTVIEVLHAAPGAQRNDMITIWSASVWDAYDAVHHQVQTLWYH